MNWVLQLQPKLLKCFYSAMTDVYEIIWHKIKLGCRVLKILLEIICGPPPPKKKKAVTLCHWISGWSQMMVLIMLCVIVFDLRQGRAAVPPADGWPG